MPKTKTSKQAKKSPAKTKLGQKKSLRLPVPKARQILLDAWGQIFTYPKLFLGITAVYGLLNYIFVKSSVGSLNIDELMQESGELFAGGANKLGAGLSVLSYLATSASTSASDAAGVYQTFLFVIGSLALIWALRRTQSAKSTSVKAAFYQSTHPLVPFILALSVIGLQMLPALLGIALFDPVINGTIGSTATEKLLFGAASLLLALLSLYMLCSSIFALYIVALPNMAPLKALRLARQLVIGRRLQIARKLIFLPSLIVVSGTIIMLPIILWLPALAEPVFFALTIFAMTLSHSYLYTLYRKLL